jgi:ParB/RepB/Spo0J family partition protein
MDLDTWRRFMQAAPEGAQQEEGPMTATPKFQPDAWRHFVQAVLEGTQEEERLMTATPKYQLVPIDQIHDSPLNPRRHVDPARTQELVESIKQHGVIDPLILRPVNGQYEIASGHRRRAAAALVGLQDLPAIIRPLTDAELLDIVMTENVQQETLHPLDEAEGFRRMQQLDPLMTPAAIGTRIGKSVRYVYDRLTLAKLIPTAKKAFESDALTAAHAIEIARLTPEDQVQALAAAFQTVWNADGQGHEAKDLISLRALKREIAEHCRLNPLDESTQAELPQLAEAMMVALDAGGPLLEVSTGNKADCPKGIKAQGAWREVGKRDHCDFARPAVIVHGVARRGEVLDVCATRKCKKHFPPKPKPEAKTKQAPKYDWKAESEKRKTAQERWDKIRPLALRQLAEKTAKLKVTNELLEQIIAHRAPYGRMNELRKLLGAPVTLRTFAQAWAIADALDRSFTEESFKPFARVYHIHLPAIAKELNLDEAKTQTPAKSEKAEAKPQKVREGKFGEARARAVSRLKTKGKAKKTRGHK